MSTAIKPKQALACAFSAIAQALHAAHAADDADQSSGDSNRLLETAANMADCYRDNPPSEEHVVERVGFDIAALIKASRLVPGDVESTERAKLIEKAKPHLVWLTDAATCLDSDERLLDRFDLQDFANEAMSLNVFVEWAISARDLLQSVRVCAEIDENLAGALRAHDIRHNAADWHANTVGDGLSYVMSRQHRLLKQIVGVSEQ
ncbi:hypothetical protein [Variovorax rhizosphaerae]|uniref:Uncharacterized protein n=1 Tax=Variovorax rhizosphaerae TaxID=1836200 RepID=A0ABU8WG38_9BURK